MSGENKQYFSKIQLKSPSNTNTELLKYLSTPEGEHRLMWKFFEGDPDQERDFLFRRLIDKPLPTFLTLSKRSPSIRNEDLWTIDTKPFDPNIQKGMALQFSLRANTTVKKDGSRHGVVMNKKHELKEENIPRSDWPSQAEIEYQAGWEWINNRDQKNGFKLSKDHFQVDRHETYRFQKHSSERKVTLEVLDMTGVLTVTSPEKFHEALENGIGRSKAYGCGLMMVKLQ